MKTTMLSVVLAASTMVTACGQTSVPSAVKQAFTKQFANAKSVKWGKEGSSEYEAEFKMNGQELSANYSESGQWMETETDMEVKDLPSAVMQTIQSQFAGYKLKEAAKVDMPNAPSVYEVDLKKGDKALEVQFSPDGKVVNQKNDNEDAD